MDEAEGVKYLVWVKSRSESNTRVLVSVDPSEVLACHKALDLINVAMEFASISGTLIVERVSNGIYTVVREFDVGGYLGGENDNRN